MNPVEMTPAANQPLVAGDAAPLFSLPDDSGGVVSLTACRGRKFVLYFYPKDDTPGCTAEAADFTANFQAFETAGARILGISPDSRASHEKFKTKQKLEHTLLSDDGHKMAEAYGVWVEKNMYGRKYMGVERATFLVDGEGRIARIWRKVKVVGHAKEVLAAAKSL